MSVNRITNKEVKGKTRKITKRKNNKIRVGVAWIKIYKN